MRRLITLSILTFAVAFPAAAEPAAAHNLRPAVPNSYFGQGESNSDYFMRLSDEAFHAGNYERAVQLHKARAAIDPEATDSFGVAAWLLWSLGRGGEAIEFLQQGERLNPDNWEMFDEAGQHFDLQKQFANAAVRYKRALQLIPADEPSQMVRRRFAHATEKSGDLPGARDIWRALVKDYPDIAVNKSNLNRIEQAIAAGKTTAR